MNENLAIKLPVFETMKNAWKKVKNSKITFILFFICLAILKAAEQGLYAIIDQGYITQTGLILAVLVTILPILILQGFIYFGMIYVGIQRATELPIRFGLIKHVFKIGILFRMTGFWLLAGMLLFLPSVILIVTPKLITLFPDSNLQNVIKLFAAILNIIGLGLVIYIINLLCRLSLVPAFIIVKKSGLFAAIKSSFKTTKSNVWRIIPLYLLSLSILMSILILEGYTTLLIGVMPHLASTLILGLIPLSITVIWGIPYICILYGEIYKKLAVLSH